MLTDKKQLVKHGFEPNDEDKSFSCKLALKINSMTIDDN